MNIETALKAARSAVESLYDGKATVTVQKEITDPETKVTSFQEMQMLIEQDCHLSIKSIPAANQTSGGAALTQTIKLFIAPEIKIEPGSKITVLQNDVVGEYECSGIPAVYQTHQEIELTNWKEWA